MELPERQPTLTIIPQFGSRQIDEEGSEGVRMEPQKGSSPTGGVLGSNPDVPASQLGKMDDWKTNTPLLITKRQSGFQAVFLLVFAKAVV